METFPQAMDPALWELVEGNPEDEIEAVVRLDPEAPAPPGVRLVARMGDVATCRLERGAILAARAADQVESLKAQRLLTPETPTAAEVEEPPRPRDDRRPEALGATGRGTVVGVVDWGCDVAHPDFRNDDGSTRILALWDQRGPGGPASPQPYDYGVAHTAADIDRALATDDPYRALGYHPADGDPDGSGSHGTHVLSIAAGNGRGGGPVGMAPDAAIVFVHLAARQAPALLNLGDSVTVLEAVDFVARTAGERPWVVNLSVGRHGGPHDGSTLVEQGFDNLLAGGDGRCIVQSCGNYYDQSIHASGRLRPGEERVLRWNVDAADVTPNELEVWYPARDSIVVQVSPPGGGDAVRLALGESAPLRVNGREVGRAYHRRHDPNNASHHVDVFLDPGSPAGAWHVGLVGDDVVDGRFHAWVERDPGCPTCQSRFARDDSDRRSTTGTICNGLRSVAIGAYDAHSPERPLAGFSSSGPTLDGRQKPDFLAPGVRVLAARSAPAGASGPVDGQLYTRKSGTSMAAPFGTGLVACLYEAAGRPLAVAEVRSALASTADPVGAGVPRARAGNGYLDAAAAVEAARRLGSHEPRARPARAVPAVHRPRAPVLAAGELYAPAAANGASLLEEAAVEAEASGAAPELLDPADVFDALAYGRLPTLRPYYERLFEVVAAPGEEIGAVLHPGDLLIERALGEGKVSQVSRLSSGATIEADDLEEAGLEATSGAAGLYVEVDDERGLARPVGDALGRLGPGRMIVRARTNGAAREAVESGSVLHTCRPGEGPPAAEPDPTGKGPHPLIRAGASTTHSRRPSVGFAQQCLNNFLAQLQAGTHTCKNQSAQARTFIEQNLRTLASAGSIPLAVDCRFGPNTKRATQIFQMCMAIDVDGEIGRITWPLLEAFATATATFTLLVDADRDGTVDGTAPSVGAWHFGAAGKGAIVLVNNDDDGVNGKPDNEDAAVDAGNDARELAPLAIERSGTPPVGTTLDLLVDDSSSIRILSGSGAGGTEIIGPAAGASHRFANLSAQRIELAMEGVRYARPGFAGEVKLTLRTGDPAGAVTEQSTVVRVAPWIMPNHLDAAEIVFVADAGTANERFRRELKALVTAAGCKLVEIPIGHNDVWVQDCMEFGFANLPGAGLRSVFRAARDRPLRTVPKTLLDADLGYFEEGTIAVFNSLDSHGNLEAAPPTISTTGKRFPFGRVYFGGGASERMDSEVIEFLRRQVVQDPIEIDTTWLAVGHVDEVFSIVPAPTASGFKLVVASPERGYAVLSDLERTNPTDKLLIGRRFPLFSTPGRSDFDAEQTIGAFLKLNDDFHPDLASGIASGTVSHTPKRLRLYNDDRQRDIDGIRRTLQTELGIDDADVIHIPAIFMPNPHMPTLADALVAGMVNMLVVNKHCIVPKPFGPVVGGVDRFEQEVRDKLTPLGLTVSFLDCWDEYHVNLGEVHCATNTLRAPTAVRWWEFEP